MLVASCSISPPIIRRATGSPSRDLMTTIWGGLVGGVCPCGFITAETGRDILNSSPLTNTDHQAGFPGKFSQQTSRLVAASNYLDHDQISCHSVSECQNKTDHCLLQGGSQTPWKIVSFRYFLFLAEQKGEPTWLSVWIIYLLFIQILWLPSECFYIELC